jgi:hypothetical protein
MFEGVSTFEFINISMILLSFIALGLKYGYDSLVEDKVFQATKFI